MLLIWGFEQYRRPAAQWHDGQLSHDAYARIARRANHLGADRDPLFSPPTTSVRDQH